VAYDRGLFNLYVKFDWAPEIFFTPFGVPVCKAVATLVLETTVRNIYIVLDPPSADKPSSEKPGLELPTDCLRGTLKPS